MQEAAADFCAFYLHGCSTQVSLEELQNVFPTSVDELQDVHETYCEIDELLQDAKKNARKITPKLHGLWEEWLEVMLPENRDNCDTPEARERADCCCTLLYDCRKKLHVATQKLQDAEAGSAHIEILESASDTLYTAFVQFEAQWGLMSLVADRVRKKLGQLPEPDTENQADDTPKAVQSMTKLRDMLEKDVEGTKKVEFLLTVLRKEYQNIMQEAQLLHEMEEAGKELPELSSEQKQLMDGEVLRQVTVLYVKALRMVAEELLSIREPQMPKALEILLGADWRRRTEPERSSRLRALSGVFHPDKINWFDRGILEEADIVHPRQIYDVQTVITSAMGYLKAYFETVETAREDLAMASRKWEEAVEKSEKERDAVGQQKEARAKSFKSEKEKCAFEALARWRRALRVLSNPQKMECQDGAMKFRASNVRTQMAEACEMLGMFLECQVYLLSAMRITARGVSECRFSETDKVDLEKHRRQWLTQRSFLKRLADRDSPRKSIQDAADPASQTKVLSLPDKTFRAMLKNNLESESDLKELVRATSDFDIKTGLVMGAAIDNLCADGLAKRKVETLSHMSIMAQDAAVASLGIGQVALTGALCIADAGLALVQGFLVAHAITGTVWASAALAVPVGGVIFAGWTALAYASFWVVGKVFGWRSRRAKRADEDDVRKGRQSVVIEIMKAADEKRRSGEETAGLQFLQALGIDLSGCKHTTDKEEEMNMPPNTLFKMGTRILKFPSQNFTTTGELVEDVEGTIEFLAEDIGICAAGVLTYLVNVAEIIAGRQLCGLCDGVRISQPQALTGAKQLLSILLDQSGGVNKQRKHEEANLELKSYMEDLKNSKDKAMLLKKARKEDQAEQQQKRLEQMFENGVVKILLGTEVEHVDAFLTQGWTALYIDRMPPVCDTIEHKNLVEHMTVGKVEVTHEDGSKSAIQANLAEIKKLIDSQDYKTIEIEAVRGTRERISNFVRMCWSSAPSGERGPKEKEIIKLREILKINLAIVFLISNDSPAEATTDKSPHEIIAEWLLDDVISTIKAEGLGDTVLMERVEALKDFYLVFVGRRWNSKTGGRWNSKTTAGETRRRME